MLPYIRSVHTSAHRLWQRHKIINISRAGAGTGPRSRWVWRCSASMNETYLLRQTACLSVSLSLFLSLSLSALSLCVSLVLEEKALHALISRSKVAFKIKLLHHFALVVTFVGENGAGATGRGDSASLSLCLYLSASLPL